MTPEASAVVLASIEGIKAAFRRVPGSNEMDRSREAWLARAKAVRGLREIAALADEAEYSLEWASQRPDRSEEDADAPLRGLLGKVLAFFGLPPIPLPANEALAVRGDGTNRFDTGHGPASRLPSLSTITGRDSRG